MSESSEDLSSIRSESGIDRTSASYVSLLSLINALLRRWRLVVGLPLGLALAVALLSQFLTPGYSATATFVPEGTNSNVPPVLSGLAGQFGVSFASEGSQGAPFYAEVLMSPRIMNQVLETQFRDPRPGTGIADSVTLVALLGVGAEARSESLETGRELLGDIVTPRVDAATSIVSVDVVTQYPELSAEVANTFVRYLDAFNTVSRQSQARARRQFVEGRLAEADAELRAVEDSLRAFYERNRSWRDSPQLALEEERLRRHRDLREQVRATLVSTYEDARIQEVNDTPVITVIDWAATPHKKSEPQVRLLILLSIAVGGLLSVFGALGAEYFNRIRWQAEAEYEEFLALLPKRSFGLRRLVRPFRRRSKTVSDRRSPRGDE